MTDIDKLHLTIDFRDNDLDSEEMEELTQNVFEQMDSLEEVEKVERIREKPTADVKAGEDLGKWLSGILNSSISFLNVEPVVKFVFRFFSGKKVKVKASAKGKTIELEAYSTSQEEVLALIQELREFAEEV